MVWYYKLNFVIGWNVLSLDKRKKWDWLEGVVVEIFFLVNGN